MDILVVSNCWVSGIELLGIFSYRSFSGHRHSCLLGRYPRVGYRVGVYWVLLGSGKPFFKQAVLIDTSASSNGNSSCSASSPTFGILLILAFSPLNFSLSGVRAVLWLQFSFVFPLWVMMQSNLHVLTGMSSVPLLFSLLWNSRPSHFAHF